MSIKMPFKLACRRQIVTCRGHLEKHRFCRETTLTPLAGEDRDACGEENVPAHRVACFGHGKVMESRLSGDREDKVIFQLDNQPRIRIPSVHGSREPPGSGECVKYFT